MEDEPGMWEENFKEHHDSKPNGNNNVFLREMFYALVVSSEWKIKQIVRNSEIVWKTFPKLNFRNVPVKAS